MGIDLPVRIDGILQYITLAQLPLSRLDKPCGCDRLSVGNRMASVTRGHEMKKGPDGPSDC
jgi:hypothetical protein